MKWMSIRGSQVVISVNKSAHAATLLTMAVTKYSTHHWKFVASSHWIMCYPDETAVERLPEENDMLCLDEYKQQLMKDYQ